MAEFAYNSANSDERDERTVWGIQRRGTADGWEVLLNVGLQWLGHANLQVALRIYTPILGKATTACRMCGSNVL